MNWQRIWKLVVPALGFALLLLGIVVALEYRSVPKTKDFEPDKTFAFVFACFVAGLACWSYAARKLAFDPADILLPQPDEDKPPDAWERTIAWIAKYGAVPATIAITIALAVVYSEVFQGEVNGDDLTFHFAESARLSDCIRDGDWDFWNPSANSGFASAYYYQVIPQLVSAIPTAIFGHHLFWFQLSVFLPHVLGPLAAYRGARLLGATPWQSFGAALAVGYMNGESRWGGGPKSTFGVGLYTQSWALAAFPLALGYGAKYVREGKQLAPAIMWGVFVGLCHPFGGVSLALALFIPVIVQVVAGRASAQSRILAGAVLVQLFCLLGIAAFIKFGKPIGAGMLAMFVGASIVTAGISWQRHVRHEPVWSWPGVRPILAEPARLAILGVFLGLAAMPGWLTMLVDASGFGGFPHRVDDEVGPGFKLMETWYYKGLLFDFERFLFSKVTVPILSMALPLAIVFGRGKAMRWIWAPALVFAVALGVGPHIGKTSDDLIPPVRFLGAMQTVLVMGIGIGVVGFGQYLGTPPAWLTRGMRWVTVNVLHATAIVAMTVLGFVLVTWLNDQLVPYALFPVVLLLTASYCIGIFLLVQRGRSSPEGTPAGALEIAFAVRTALVAMAGALVVMIALTGSRAIDFRIAPITLYPEKEPGKHRAEIMDIAKQLEPMPEGRKQVAAGAESHWWNQLTYVYGRRPALFQMGGGGLQASPNYDFLWSVRDYNKLAWVFDTPYIVYAKSQSSGIPAGEIVGSSELVEIRKLHTNGLVAPAQVVGVLPPGPTKANTPTRKAAIEWLKDPVKPYANQVLAYAGSGEPGPAPDATVVRAWHQNSPGDEADIYAEVVVRAPSTFLIRESWHPRWHAYVDGVEVPIRRVTPDFPAVDVPPGKHWIALRFERPWWANACWLAWPGFALLGYGLERYLRSDRRKRRARRPQ